MVIVTALVKGGHVPPAGDSVPSPFSMANPDHTRALLESAGFDTVTVDEAPLEFRFRDIHDYLGFMTDTTGPIAIALRKLSEQDRDTLAATLEVAIEGFHTNGQYTIPGAALVAAAS
jgi:hypothetical protein